MSGMFADHRARSFSKSSSSLRETKSNPSLTKSQDAQMSAQQIAAMMAEKKANEATWDRSRALASKVVNSKWFGVSMSLLICLSMVFVIMEVNHEARGSDPPAWLQISNVCILVLYFIEMCLKLYAFRCSFFSDAICVLDFIVVSIDIIVTLIVIMITMTLMPIVLARLARIMKLTRALRMMTLFPELNVLVQGLLLASRTVAMGAGFLFMLTCVWGVFATLFIHPIVQDLEREGYWASLDCERCARAFSSVEMSMLTFVQQLIVGEGWSELNTPIIEKRPATAIFFILVLVSLVLGALNLLLGIIVERAMEAKAVSAKEVASKKEKHRKEAGERLFEMCESMDGDKGGTLSVQELLAGYEENEEFRNLLHMMDVGHRDLHVVFGMLDTDGSGDVEYKEFVEQLQMLKDQDAHTLLMFIRYYIVEIRDQLKKKPAQALDSAVVATQTLMSPDQPEEDWDIDEGAL